MILCKQDLAKVIDRTVFPGIQGGPHLAAIAAKAVCFLEARQPAFRDYQEQVVTNAQALADGLMRGGMQLVSGGTDNHLLVVKAARSRLFRAKLLARALEGAGIITSMSTVPGETRCGQPSPAAVCASGTPAVTTRGATIEQHAAGRRDRQHHRRKPRRRGRHRPPAARRRSHRQRAGPGRLMLPAAPRPLISPAWRRRGGRPCCPLRRAGPGLMLLAARDRERCPGALSPKSWSGIRHRADQSRWSPGYVDRVISTAERSNAAAVVFDMDTPGGLSAAMQDIDARLRTARCAVIVCTPNAAVPSSPGRLRLQPGRAARRRPRISVDGEQVQSPPCRRRRAAHRRRDHPQRADMSPGESLLLAITNPTIAYLLLTLGALGPAARAFSPRRDLSRRHRRHLPAAGLSSPWAACR